MACSVREAQQRVDPEEFCDWQAFWSIDPQREELDRMMARICQTIAVFSGRSKDVVPLSDFRLFEEKPTVVVKDLEEVKRSANAFFGS